MAKRKASLRRSGRFSRNRHSLLYNSTVLNPNSSILDEDRTFWWNDLEENTPLRHSLIHNTGNETSGQLNPNSEMEASHNLSQWWKNLSTNESNSSSSKEDLKKINKVTVRARPNTIASTTSESENEVSITKKKRINLRPARKKTEENVFLNVLNNAEKNSVTESIKLKSKLQKQHSDSSINELLEVKLHKDTEDSPVVSSNSKRLRSNIFKKKRSNQVEDRAQNIFQDALTEDGLKLSNSLSRITRISAHSEDEDVDIESIDNENTENSSTLSLNTRNLKSNVFKKKRGNKIKDRTPNIFQDALKEDRSRISDSTSKVPKTSTQPANKNVNIEDINNESMENSATLSSNSRRLRSNIFKSKKDNLVEDHAQNIFQDALTKDGSKLSNSLSRITRFSAQSENEDVDIETVDNENMENSATLSSNSRRLRSNIFKSKKDNQVEDYAQNIFQDALTKDRSKLSNSLSRITKLSTQSANEEVDIEDDNNKNTENSATLSLNTRSLRSNVFKKKRGNKMEDRTQKNIFQDALKEDRSRISDSTSKVPKISTQSTNNVNIEDVDNENMENSATLSLNTRAIRSNIFKNKRDSQVEALTRNIFQDALTEDRSRMSDSTNRTANASTQFANENVDIEDVGNENMENSSNLSLNTRITSRPNVFKKKKGNNMEDRTQKNTFQDAPKEDRSRISDSTSKVPKISTQSTNNVNIEDVDNENMENSATLSLNTRALRSNIFKNKRGSQVEALTRNIFQDALTEDRSRMSDSTNRTANVSTQFANENVDIEDVGNENMENSSNLSLNTRITSRPNVFKKKKGNNMEDRTQKNTFQDAPKEDRSRISDSTSKVSKISTQSTNNVNIEDVDNENMENSATLSLNTRALRSNIFKNKRGSQVEALTRNIFQDALTEDRSRMSDSTNRTANVSTQFANENVDIEDVGNENMENSPNLSLNTRIISRSNVFKNKRGNQVEDGARNIFQDALAKDRSKMLDSTKSTPQSRVTKLSMQSENEDGNIEDDNNKSRENSSDLSLNTRRLRSNVFMKKRDNEMEGRTQNIFQDALAEDGSKMSRSTSRTANVSAQFANKNKRGSQVEDRAQSISKDAEDESEISDSVSRATKLSAQSENRIVDIENVDDTSMPFEIDVGSVPTVRSTRVSSTEIHEGNETHKNTTLSFNTTDKNVPAPETDQRKYPSSANRRSRKSVNRPAVSADVSQNSNKGNTKILGRQNSLNRSSRNYNTSTKSLNKDVSISNNKLNSSKKLKTIDDFFKMKPSSTAEPSNTKNLASSLAFNEKMEKIKMELKKLKQTKEHEVAATDKKKYELKVRSGANPANIVREQRARKKLLEKPKKIVNKAFLVNGKVYKVPKLPRPKHWVTNRLYKFLWKNMEEKYKFSTRVKSEKFIQELAKMVSFICKCKKYDSYKMELKALMKEMARLNIIKTRDDFYHFCWEYMPYEFRVKVVPMLLPNNKRTIPYNPEMLYTPILDDDGGDDDDDDDDDDD